MTKVDANKVARNGVDKETAARLIKLTHVKANWSPKRNKPLFFERLSRTWKDGDIDETTLLVHPFDMPSDEVAQKQVKDDAGKILDLMHTLPADKLRHNSRAKNWAGRHVAPALGTDANDTRIKAALAWLEETKAIERGEMKDGKRALVPIWLIL